MALSLLQGLRSSTTTPEPTALALEQLQDHELAALAAQWRSHALRGDRRARGYAHLCEVEVRRRHSYAAEPFLPDALDLRSLAQRSTQKPWWKFW
jgi:hypothetical protein